MKHQLQTIRESLEGADRNYTKALTALSELERMAGEPVAWKHDCAALLANDVELWIDNCPHCGRPRAAPPAKQPQYEAGDVASAAAQGFRDGVASVTQQPQEPVGEVVQAFADLTVISWADNGGKFPPVGTKLYTAPVAQQDEHLTITWDEQQTRILAVTMQDEEGRILKVLAEAPATAQKAAAAQGFRDGAASVTQQEPVGYLHPQAKQRLENSETVAFRKTPYAGEPTLAVYVGAAPVAQQARADLEAENQRLREALERAELFIDDVRQDLHHERIADWYPEGAHSSAAAMSESMRMIGNRCADFEAEAALESKP